jgi:hypothetical protein
MWSIAWWLLKRLLARPTLSQCCFCFILYAFVIVLLASQTHFFECVGFQFLFWKLMLSSFGFVMSSSFVCLMLSGLFHASCLKKCILYCLILIHKCCCSLVLWHSIVWLWVWLRTSYSWPQWQYVNLLTGSYRLLMINFSSFASSQSCSCCCVFG